MGSDGGGGALSDGTSSGPGSDEEMPYETVPRKRRASWEPEGNVIERLPIKLADGRVQKTGIKVAPQVVQDTSGEESDEEPPTEEAVGREDVSTGARFGRPAVVDIIGNKSRKARIQGAKEQIAGLCQEIVSDPENSVSGLTGLTGRKETL